MMNDISYFDSCQHIHLMDALRLPLASILTPLLFVYNLTPPIFNRSDFRVLGCVGLRVYVSHFSVENCLLPTANQNQQKSCRKSAVSLPLALLLISVLDSIHCLAAIVSCYSYHIFNVLRRFLFLCCKFCVHLFCDSYWNMNAAWYHQHCFSWLVFNVSRAFNSFHFTNVLLIPTKHISSKATYLNLMVFVLLIVSNGEWIQCVGFFFWFVYTISFEWG